MGIVQKKSKGITAAVLKIIAMATMLIDHIAATIIERILVSRGMNEVYSEEAKYAWLHVGNNMLLNEMYSWMRIIGRLAFPLFAFLITEGFFYTRDRWKYFKRLALFAIISEIPFDLAFYDSFFQTAHQNVFFTLALAVLGLIGYTKIKESPLNEKFPILLKNLGYACFGFMLWYIFAISILGKLLEYNGVIGTLFETWMVGPFYVQHMTLSAVIVGIGVATATIILFNVALRGYDQTFVAKEAIGWFPICGCILLASLLCTDYSCFGVFVIALMYLRREKKVSSMVTGCVTLSILNPTEISAFIDVFLVKYYNGQKGKQLKWSNYIFYPAHLAVLALICYLCKL